MYLDYHRLKLSRIEFAPSPFALSSQQFKALNNFNFHLSTTFARVYVLDKITFGYPYRQGPLLPRQSFHGQLILCRYY